MYNIKWIDRVKDIFGDGEILYMESMLRGEKITIICFKISNIIFRKKERVCAKVYVKT